MTFDDRRQAEQTLKLLDAGRPRDARIGRQAHPAGTRHGNKFLTSMLVEAAQAASRTKDTYLSAQFARLTSRRGHNRAAVAVAHSILVSAYWMLVRDEPYHDLGAGWLDEPRRAEAHTRRLVTQLEHLGHTVVLDPAS